MTTQLSDTVCCMVRCTAYAKINLFLEICGRRDDGYHHLYSLMAFVSMGDVLSFRPSPPGTGSSGCCLHIEGEQAKGVPGGAENLVNAAAKAMADWAGKPVNGDFTLIKNIPAAAGLGGGSADGAALIRSLAALWKIDIKAPAIASSIESIALSLGADIPFFLKGKAAYVSGVGERISPIGYLPPLGVLLVNPGCPLSTADVFADYAGPGATRTDGELSPLPPLSIGDFQSPEAFVRAITPRENHLTSAACRLLPDLEAILVMLSGLEGVLLARMSGSGPTCFGLFPDIEKARQAGERLRHERADLWVRPATLVSSTPAAELV